MSIHINKMRETVKGDIIVNSLFGNTRDAVDVVLEVIRVKMPSSVLKSSHGSASSASSEQRELTRPTHIQQLRKVNNNNNCLIINILFVIIDI